MGGLDKANRKGMRQHFVIKADDVHLATKAYTKSWRTNTKKSGHIY